MATKQDPAIEDPKPVVPDVTPPVATDPPAQPSADSTPSDDGPPKGYVSEESYKGLQRVLGTKDDDLKKLQTSVSDLSEELEKLKGDSTGLATDKGDLEKKLEDAKTSADTLQTERDKLSKQVERQSVIMKKFPDLAPLAEYIPHADNAEAFEANAKAFQEALGTHVDAGVKAKITGATDLTPVGTDDTTSKSAELDNLWTTMMRTDGDPAKKDEYQKAKDRYEELMPD